MYRESGFPPEHCGPIEQARIHVQRLFGFTKHGMEDIVGRIIPSEKEPDEERPELFTSTGDLSQDAGRLFRHLVPQGIRPPERGNSEHHKNSSWIRINSGNKKRAEQALPAAYRWPNNPRSSAHTELDETTHPTIA
jgi:hypothetical protein